MPLVSTPAVVLSALRYGETSKIVRLATREHGVQSAIAKGAYRPRSRFGAALQLLSTGQAHLILSDRRDLHILTAFDLQALHVDLARDLDRYAAASALAEVTLRFGSADPHPEVFDFLTEALNLLERSEPAEVPAGGLRLLWTLTGILGFAPSLEECVRDGAPIPPGELPFSAEDGGALCPACARDRQVARLASNDRADLLALHDLSAPLPRLDVRHAAAHRRLFDRYIRHHLGQEGPLPALEFWGARAWESA
jgi:DNA repair protein RecO (recombination protein O)